MVALKEILAGLQISTIVPGILQLNVHSSAEDDIFDSTNQQLELSNSNCAENIALFVQAKGIKTYGPDSEWTEIHSILPDNRNIHLQASDSALIIYISPTDTLKFSTHFRFDRRHKRIHTYGKWDFQLNQWADNYQIFEAGEYIHIKLVPLGVSQNFAEVLSEIETILCEIPKQ